MGSLFQSERMCQAQLFLQSEAAYNCLAELGELGMVQFRDLNENISAFQRKYVNDVRKCDEMERKLRYVEKEVKAAEITITEGQGYIPSPLPRELIDLEATFEKIESELREVNQNREVLQRNYLELTEHNHVLCNTDGFFVESSHFAVKADEIYHQEQDSDTGGASGSYKRFSNESDIESAANVQSATTLGFMAGAIHRERIHAFEQMLWRICRGNVFIRYSEILMPLSDPHTGDEVHKYVFIVFYQGEQIGIRIRKVCEGFRATLYTCPPKKADRAAMAEGVSNRLSDLTLVLNEMQAHRQRILNNAAGNLWAWFVKVRKMKAIFHTLNLFDIDVTRGALIGECWCPVADLENIRIALSRGTERSGSTLPSIIDIVPTTSELPTFNRTNKFTSGFQEMVDAYGVANYREVNPAPFTIITFPFLFAVMFGDSGHGLLMTLFAAALVFGERRLLSKKHDNEMFSIVFGGRYIILLMGLFSIYTGFLYNDTFSKSMNIFGSEWNACAMNYSHDLLQENITLQLDPKYAFTGSPYPFGMDPIWQVAENKLNFLNPFKMRLSIILGICHMFFGVSLSLVNHINRDPTGIPAAFIPQVLFLGLLFGYLVFLIFIKWFRFDSLLTETAPNLIETYIGMFLMQNIDNPVFEKASTQNAVQICILVIALICIPWMLFMKPVIKSFTKRNPTYLQGKKKLSLRFARILMQRRVQEDEVVEIVMSEDEASEGAAYGRREDSIGNSSLEKDGNLSSDNSVSAEPISNTRGGGGGHGGGEEDSLGEQLVLQAIHTIEFCLGCISNTASYLRLWALSLAHAELSEVLWTMVMQNGIGLVTLYPDKQSPMTVVWLIVGGFAMFSVFAFWAALTIGILLLMEGLSAFLHALRLHWVEFQNKFYTGEGYLFQPFSFKKIVEQEE
ncbi:V-type proton ATPase 116 kDa subunit a 1-like isoform X2 [Apostichopus japonicus]|uniref:V-type proton ATPase 116 kDa subunit a 1-like isoform X2 n=1 Tax=Stichopus japonicus TaxID=307972 RepID=UPI003AB8D1D9